MPTLKVTHESITGFKLISIQQETKPKDVKKTILTSFYGPDDCDQYEITTMLVKLQDGSDNWVNIVVSTCSLHSIRDPILENLGDENYASKKTLKPIEVKVDCRKKVTVSLKPSQTPLVELDIWASNTSQYIGNKIQRVKGLEELIKTISENGSRVEAYHIKIVKDAELEITKIVTELFDDRSIKNIGLSKFHEVTLANGTDFPASQGLPKTNNERLYRTAMIRTLFNRGVEKKMVLTYSPPFSGKTSVLQLLMLYSTIICNKKVFMIPCASFTTQSSNIETQFEDFVRYAALKNQLVMQMISGKSTRTDEEDYKIITGILSSHEWIILLDDVHRAYCVTKLWDILQEAKNTVFGFASYDTQQSLGRSSTPLCFTERCTLDNQLFSRAEFDELATKFENKTHIYISEFIRNQVFNLTSGYPGLVSHSLALLTVTFPKQGVGSSDVEIMEKFNSGCVYQTITNYKENRCFKKLEEIIENVQAQLINVKTIDGDLYDLAKRAVVNCLYSLFFVKKGTIEQLTNNLAVIKPVESLLSHPSLEIISLCFKELAHMCVVYRNEQSEFFFPIPLFERFYMDEVSRVRCRN